MANIKLNNNEYPIPDSALSAVRAEFVAHLGTIAGNGMKVVVGGVEYGVDAAKVAGVVSELEGVFGELNSGGGSEATLAAGLYETGAIALYEEQGASAIEGMMITSWDDLLADGTIHVEDGAVFSNWNEDDWENPSSNDLTGELILPDDGSITAIGNGYIDEDWNYVGGFGFNGCESLSRILIPKSVVSICHGAFNECYALESIEIPASVESIGAEAFMYCEALTNVVFTEGIKLVSIEHDSFYECTNLTGITIPDSVTNIGNYAFQSCTSLTSVDFGDNSQLTSIGESVFEDCSSLTNIAIIDSITSIGNNVFKNCSSLTNITIPNSVTSIGSGAFLNCTGLTSITISDGVTSIGASEFYNCRNLTSITIPDSVTRIGNGAFNYCSSLASITVVEGNSKYHSYQNCLIDTSTKTLIAGCNNSIIPTDDSVTSIDNRAFSGRTNLSSITIPDSVTSIGAYAFDNCSSLTSITIPFVGAKKDISSNAHFGYIFGATSAVGYGGNKQRVPSSLKSVVITGGTSIAKEAFCECSSLTSITIPDSVTSIGVSGFSHCTSLANIYYNGTTAQWNAITKGNMWNADVPATHIQCSDGQVTL